MRVDFNDLRDLRQRFEDALFRVGVVPGGGHGRESLFRESLFLELVERHTEGHRHYHTLVHVESCLIWLDWSAGLALHPGEVALAIWFHDAIYEPRASDNEAQSALLARARLSALGVPRESLDRIAAHIEATRLHGAEHPDSRLVVDVDLTILGATPSRYDEFERAIREEYRHVPDELFEIGRRRILAEFLARPAIFQLPAFREALERGARENLARRLAA